LDRLLVVDEKRRELMTAVEAARAKQNEASQKIPTASPVEREQLLSEMKVLKDALVERDEELKSVMVEWQTLMVQVPNIPDISVPEGESDKDNKEVRNWGEKTKFSFTPKSHIEIMESLKMVDFERGTKVAGFRGYFLKGPGAILNMAVWQHAQRFFTEKGFNPIIVPSLLRRVNFLGTGYIPQGEDDLYKTQDADYLAGTAEVGLMGYHMNDVLNMDELPLKYLGFSPCFRREAGSHSKDVKGLIRVHEFYKWEQVLLCEASHEESAVARRIVSGDDCVADRKPIRDYARRSRGDRA
jgi:seryl-tRNA synthetase